jgi:hypothetical protein
MSRSRVGANRRPGLRCILRKPAGLAALVVALVASQPSSAQKIHSSEPLMMDPYSTIYVDDGSCSAGKVLRVQGVPKNQRRKKSCVPLDSIAGGAHSGARK